MSTVHPFEQILVEFRASNTSWGIFAKSFIKDQVECAFYIGQVSPLTSLIISMSTFKSPEFCARSAIREIGPSVDVFLDLIELEHGATACRIVAEYGVANWTQEEIAACAIALALAHLTNGRHGKLLKRLLDRLMIFYKVATIDNCISICEEQFLIDYKNNAAPQFASSSDMVRNYLSMYFSKDLVIVIFERATNMGDFLESVNCVLRRHLDNCIKLEICRARDCDRDRDCSWFDISACLMSKTIKNARYKLRIKSVKMKRFESNTQVDVFECEIHGKTYVFANPKYPARDLDMVQFDKECLAFVSEFRLFV